MQPQIIMFFKLHIVSFGKGRSVIFFIDYYFRKNKKENFIFHIFHGKTVML